MLQVFVGLDLKGYAKREKNTAFGSIASMTRLGACLTKAELLLPGRKKWNGNVPKLEWRFKQNEGL